MKIDWNRLPPQFRSVNAKRVACTTVASVILSLVYGLVAPNWYQSTLTVVPSTPSRGPSLGVQIAGALGADLPIDLGNNVDVERIAAVFESTSVGDAVIRNFDLKSRYGEEYLEHTRKELWRHCSTHIDRKARLVSLTCEDRDPNFVQQMLRFFGEYGNQVFRRVSATSATEEVRFLEQRVAEMRREADDVAHRLQGFEERYKIIDLESQSKAVVAAMASLRSQEISKELQLSYLNSFSARDESTAIQLRQQLAVMNAKFRKLEDTPAFDDSTSEHGSSRGSGDPPKSANIFPPALSVPRLRFELEQLYRDRKIREGDLLLLMQRLEMARVTQARDTSAFQVLDDPAFPTYKNRPRRLLIVLLGLVAGLLVGLGWTLGPAYLHALLTDQR